MKQFISSSRLPSTFIRLQIKNYLLADLQRFSDNPCQMIVCCILHAFARHHHRPHHSLPSNMRALCLCVCVSLAQIRQLDLTVAFIFPRNKINFY